MDATLIAVCILAVLGLVMMVGGIVAWVAEERRLAAESIRLQQLDQS